MMHHIKLTSFVLTCTLFSMSAMNRFGIRDIPEYCTKITKKLQEQVTCFNTNEPYVYGHRIIGIYKPEDCLITTILCENVNILCKNSSKKYFLEVTSFQYRPRYINIHTQTIHNGNIIYGIKSPSDNQNFLTRRSGFKVIDALQSGWVELSADDYYTHPHKAKPADNPYQDTINNWRFFSKRTDRLRPHFLLDEPLLIESLAKRFGMADKITCRTTLTNDLKRIAAIHIWVLKSAFEEFNQVFDFEYKTGDNNLNQLTNI